MLIAMIRQGGCLHKRIFHMLATQSLKMVQCMYNRRSLTNIFSFDIIDFYVSDISPYMTNSKTVVSIIPVMMRFYNDFYMRM